MELRACCSLVPGCSGPMRWATIAASENARIASAASDLTTTVLSPSQIRAGPSNVLGALGARMQPVDPTEWHAESSLLFEHHPGRAIILTAAVGLDEVSCSSTEILQGWMSSNRPLSEPRNDEIGDRVGAVLRTPEPESGA